VAKARALLKAAGYRGQRITITVNKRLSTMFDAAVLAESMLRAAGFNARIEVIEWSLQLSRYNAGEYQSMVFAYSGRFTAGGVWDRFVGAEPTRPWHDPDTVKLVGRIDEAPPPEAAKAAAEVRRRFETDVPAVGLFLPDLYVARNRRVQGYKGGRFDALRLWNVSIDGDRK